MKRSETIKIVLNCLNDKDIALFTTGMISREAFDIKDRKGNFYMIGSMGLISSVALGVALNTIKRVFIFDGDGSILMDMGTMATIGLQKPSNLVHIVFDNESYQSTGGQPSVSKTAQLDKIAMDSGYVCSIEVTATERLKVILRDIVDKKGPFLVLLKVLERSMEEPKRVSFSPVQIRERFMRFLKGG
jgi:thiamine pyrophosphate-dependent acetolactate synthase large subunit-like protein